MKRKKKRKSKDTGYGYYTCPYCGYKDSSPLYGHSCWQGSPGALETEARINRKIAEEEA